jgi:hypothetical protein
VTSLREHFWTFRQRIWEDVVGRLEYSFLAFSAKPRGKDPASAVLRRSFLPLLLRRLGLNGSGVELGVFKGEYSQQILSGSKLKRLYSVDRWAGDRGHDDAQMEETRQTLACFGDRSVLIQATFEEALDRFDDGSLDFVYVDGYAHNGNEDGRTFAQWWPKVRPGGIMAGHDYHSRFERNVRAVDAFAKAHGLMFHLTRKDKLPSWIVRKS